MNDVTTTDLSQFGYRELDEAGELLLAIKNGLPDDFNDEGITIMFNRNSGNVFLTNSDYQVAMFNPNSDSNDLESFYNCFQCGNEGFNTDNEEATSGEEYPFKKYDGYCSKECMDKNL